MEERRAGSSRRSRRKASARPSSRSSIAPERQLQRLDREKAQTEAQQKALSDLDRDLAKAAQDLMKDLGMGSQDLQKGAQDINRAAGQRMSEQQKEEAQAPD